MLVRGVKLSSKLTCKTCGVEKDLNSFSLHKECKSGYDISRCKDCKKSKIDWRKVPLEKRILNRCKSRAVKLKRDFDLDLSDIIIPEVCPVFKTPFIYGHPDWTYSIDRIDNRKGYVKGNILIVSNKANRLKNNASIEDLQIIIDFYKDKG